MSFSKEEIANYALVLLGNTNDTITSLSGDRILKDNERIIAKVIDKIIDDCLCDILPNFAIKSIKIIKNTEDKLIIPTDCLKVLSINADTRLNQRWKIEGNEIIPLIDFMESQIIKLTYISNTTDIMQHATSGFCKYCSYSLAVECAQSLSGNLNLRSVLLNEKEHLRNVLLSRENIDNECTVIY